MEVSEIAETSIHPPQVDHHQHLFGPDVTTWLKLVGSETRAIDSLDLLTLLDDAHVRRAVILSVAYMFGNPHRMVEDEYAHVISENEWTASEVARHPQRLRAFFSCNPLKPYALEELERCSRRPDRYHGLKLHFGNSDVQLDAPEHVEKVRAVFETANAHRIPIVVHLRASISQKRAYGAEQARVFLEEILPFAPEIPVQVAHLAGSGPGYDDPAAHQAMATLADAVRGGDSMTKRLWFDVASVIDWQTSGADARRVAEFVRSVGPERVLYGSDAALGSNLSPKDGWAAFCRIPLTQAALRQISANVAEYAR